MPPMTTDETSPNRTGDPGTPESLPEAIGHGYRDDLGPKERSALSAWLGFAATFGIVRGITYSIKAGIGPFGNISAGGAHLHHYLWGIGMVSGVGAVAVRGDDSTRQHPVTALIYGAGLALIVDEFALLLDLKDVYWQRQGRVSVDIGVGVVALGGTMFSLIPIARRVRHRRR